MRDKNGGEFNKRTFRIGRTSVALWSLDVAILSICLLVLIPITILHFSEWELSRKVIVIVCIVNSFTTIILASKYLDCRIVLDKNCLTYKGVKHYLGATYFLPQDKKALVRSKDEVLGYGDKIKYEDIDGIYNIYIRYGSLRGQVVKYIAFVLKNDKPLYIRADIFSDRQIKRLIDEIIALSDNSIKDMRAYICENAS